MDVFKGQNLLEFPDRFKIDDDRKEYLASIKAKSNYKCTRCSRTSCQIRENFARKCNICGHIESATADTLFHKLKFGFSKEAYRNITHQNVKSKKIFHAPRHKIRHI